MAKFGIDISAHNGDIDIESLYKNNNLDFIIVRAGFGYSSIDKKFKRNMDIITRLNIPFGVYWYSYALNANDAKIEAESMAKALEPYKNLYSYGIWFDMEDADNYKKNHGMPSNKVLCDICETFCSYMESKGFYTGIYASQSWFNNQLKDSRLDRYDKWVALWPTKNGVQRGMHISADERDFRDMWQFSSIGKLNGYNGNLDVNYAYRDYPKLIRGNSSEKPKEPEHNVTGSTLEVAKDVILGKYGSGEERKKKLGNRYKEIQDFINHIAYGSLSDLVKETLDGKYGNNETRKTVLGNRYTAVQNEINKKYSSGSSRTYTVVKGDTLSKIGSKLGINWKTIADKNGIKSPYTIYIGQKLKY